MIIFGRVLFALSFAVIGLLSLASGDFALNWQPVPAWVGWRVPLAYMSGIVLLASGVGILFKRTAMRSAIVLTANLLIWLLLLQVPRVLTNAGTEIVWNGFGENLALVVGGSLLIASLAQPGDRVASMLMATGQGRQVARVLFGLAFLPVGLAHLVYVQPTTTLVPAWLPFRTGITYFTGVAQIAAGLGILFGVLPRLAATLEASALAIFGLLVWLPRLVATPARLSATAMLITFAISGAAWIVASALRDVAWLGTSWSADATNASRRPVHAPSAFGESRPPAIRSGTP
jgi:uncharacterized membrane protein